MADMDKRLVRRAARGDRRAAEALVQRHESAVYTLALRTFAGDAEEARDAAQEAFLRALANLSGFGGKEDFGAWIRTIVIHVCLDRLRRLKRIRSVASDAEIDQLTDPAQETPPEQGERREQEKRLYAALQELSPKQRAVIALHYQEGLRYGEIAEILQMKEELARYHAMRGKQALKKILGETFDEVNSHEL